jgi:hypothetical protein
MKKVFFLVLVFVLGIAASVNAQVRIGGSTDPFGSAVLDLNATDDPTPTANKGGLSFPRSSLDTTNVTLNGLTPKEGTLVYNTNASMKGGQGKGIYMWNGTNWNSLVASVPVTSVTLSLSGTVNIPVGATTQIMAAVAPGNATNQLVNWSSSNPGIAIVNANGLISGVAEGTSTVTTTANDGSGKMATVLINVFNDGKGIELNGTRNYDVYTLPNGLGTWMLTNSQEGIRDTINNTTYYYSKTHASGACNSPWVLPDSAQSAELIAFLNKTPAVSDLFVHSGFVGGERGRFYVTGNYFEGLGDLCAWTSDDVTGDPILSYWIWRSSAGVWELRSNNKNVYFQTVRCRKP